MDNLFTLLTNQLDELGIHYTWDPDFEHQGLLVIDSADKHGKCLSVGLTFNKDTGKLDDVDFLEILNEDNSFPVRKKEGVS